MDERNDEGSLQRQSVSDVPAEKGSMKDVVSTAEYDVKNLYEDDSLDPLYYRKTLLLNHAIQEIGMGKYQVCSNQLIIPLAIHAILYAVYALPCRWLWVVCVSSRTSCTYILLKCDNITGTAFGRSVFAFTGNIVPAEPVNTAHYWSYPHPCNGGVQVQSTISKPSSKRRSVSRRYILGYRMRYMGSKVRSRFRLYVKLKCFITQSLMSDGASTQHC